MATTKSKAPLHGDYEEYGTTSSAVFEGRILPHITDYVLGSF